MALKAAQVVNLLLTGVLNGNEFGSWAVLHPALPSCPTRPTCAPNRPSRAATGRPCPL